MSKFSQWLSELIELISNWWKSKEASDTETTTPVPPTVPKDPTSTNPPTTPVRTLEKGMTGDDVKKIQQKLKDLGYTIEVDGEYGNETVEVVTNFQRYNGIGQTGRVGPQTLAAILAAKPEKKPNGTGAVAAADLAEKEGLQVRQWLSSSSEAEKYLATVRAAIGQPTGRFSWCGAFVYWCFKQAGVEIPVAFSTGYTAAYCPGWEAWAKAKGYWYPSNLKKDEFNPRRGDIVLFNWDGDAYADHIGIVLSYDGKATIKTAEGNTSSTEYGSQTNGNSTAVKHRDWSKIKGFIRFN